MCAYYDREGLEHVLIIDGHVHIYECHGPASVLESASRNFEVQARKIGRSDAYVGVMLLAERSVDHWFERLCDLADGSSSSGGAVMPWTFHRMPEDHRVLVVRRENFRDILLVAGRQIISSEGLEVLALATTTALPDGLPAREILETVRKEAIPVLPWGFGKWLGQRGHVVRSLLQSDLAGSFYLGDNGGRPALWGTPRFFRFAHSLGMGNLPGTDPLPLSSEARRIGSFGFTLTRRLRGSFSLQHDLIMPLRKRDCTIGHYGNLLSPMRFARNQIALRLAKAGSFTAGQ